MTKAFHAPFSASGIEFSPARATDKHAYPSGGAGMVSTADDFLRFVETIRTGGAPVLAPSTAALAVRDQTGALGPGPGSGFGLLGAVLVDPKAANQPSHAGTISWGGVYGHTWWIDPAAELSVVILTNTAVEGLFGKFPVDVKAVIYRTLE
jgi:CubicO group peptidase (beta-lactamase class C family)